VEWKADELLAIEFTPKDGTKPQTIERRLSDADWQRAGSRTGP